MWHQSLHLFIMVILKWVNKEWSLKISPWTLMLPDISRLSSTVFFNLFFVKYFRQDFLSVMRTNICILTLYSERENSWAAWPVALEASTHSGFYFLGLFCSRTDWASLEDLRDQRRAKPLLFMQTFCRFTELHDNSGIFRVASTLLLIF